MQQEGRSLKRELIRFIIPSVAAQWVYALYTMVDGMFVAKGVSETALTAVNLSFPVITAMFALSLTFAVGTSTMVAIAMGKKDMDQASEIFTQNMTVQLILAVVISVAGLAGLDGLAGLLGAREGALFTYVKEYLSWILPFSAAFLLSYSFEILLKIDGYPKKATMIVVVGVIANCILDWLLVIVLRKGVAGAALATSLSQVCVIVLYLRHFLGKRGVLCFKRSTFKASQVFRALGNGFPSGLTELSAGVVTFVFNHVILLYLDQDALVSYTIVSYVNALVVMSATGIAQGSQPLISYHHGMGDGEGCRKLLRYELAAAGILCIGAFFLLLPSAGWIVSLYVSPSLPALRESSVKVFRIFLTSFWLVGFNIAVSGYLTAVERAGLALIISAGRGFVLMIGALVLIARYLGGEMIWWTPLTAEGICFVITCALYAYHVRTEERRR